MAKRLPELTKLSERATLLMTDLGGQDARKIYFKGGRRYIGDPYALEDVYHDFLIDLIPRIAHKYPGTIDEDTSVTTNKDLRHWVGSCFTNFMKNYYTRWDGKRKKRELSIDNGEEELPDRYTIDIVTPDSLLALREEEREVRMAVDQLPPRQRQVVIAHYYEDKSYSQIATELGVSVNAVHLKIKKARTTLKELLPEDLAHAA